MLFLVAPPAREVGFRVRVVREVLARLCMVWRGAAPDLCPATPPAPRPGPGGIPAVASPPVSRFVSRVAPPPAPAPPGVPAGVPAAPRPACVRVRVRDRSGGRPPEEGVPPSNVGGCARVVVHPIVPPHLRITRRVVGRALVACFAAHPESESSGDGLCTFAVPPFPTQIAPASARIFRAMTLTPYWRTPPPGERPTELGARIQPAALHSTAPAHAGV